jgi:cellulose synthase/poly-beta-1,6-N-acetylglucosamine synthase-like glycosyltransferase
MSIYVALLFLSIFLGIFTVLIGKYINYMRTTRLHVNMKRDFKPFVSVIIPTWNEADVIENTIRNIEESHYDRFEIIVVDDRSNDGTYEILKNFDESKTKDLMKFIEESRKLSGV